MIYITAIHMEGGSGEEHIARLRWTQPSPSEKGESSRAEIVRYISQKNGEVRVSDGRREVQVIVVDGHPPYLKTKADGRLTNNLLSLPRF